MRDVTIDDCYTLRKDFDTYCDTAEQHEFPLLFMVDLKFQSTLHHYEKVGCIDDQKEAQSMFRVISKIIGRQCES